MHYDTGLNVNCSVIACSPDHFAIPVVTVRVLKGFFFKFVMGNSDINKLSLSRMLSNSICAVS